MDEQPKRCRECRFYTEGYCLHDRAKSFTDIGDVSWCLATQMRGTSCGVAGACGREAKLWEPRPPLTTGQLIARWGTAAFVAAILGVFLFAR